VTYQDRFGFDNIAASYVNKATREIGFGQAFLYSGDKDGLLTEMSFISAAAFKFNVQNRFLYPFSAGASLKMVSKYFKKGSLDAVGGPGFGVGMDLGLVWKLSEPIKYGLLLRDLPVIVRYNNTVTGKQYFQSEATTLHMGGTFKVGYTTFLIAEGQLPLYEDQGWKMAGGIEQEIFGLMLLRLGAQKTIMSPIQTPWKVTAGFGVKVDMPTPLLKNLSLDGSYEYNTLGIFNVINVSMKMGF
jgi:hypothetical protein